METSIMNGMCRCCASEGVFKDVKTSYTWMGEEEVYADMLRECFDISLSTSEHGEDGGICEVCITQLRNASNFKKQVLNTEEQFKKLALNKLFKPNIVKVEVSGDDANDSDDNLSADDGYSGPEFEVPIKTEAEEPKPKKRGATTRATTSRAKKAKSDNGESSTKRPPAENDHIDTEEKQSHDSKYNDVTSRSKPTKLISNKMKKAKVKTIEIHKHRTNIEAVMLWSNATPIRRCGDMGYMCCYCDEQYREPAHLKQHTLQDHQDVRNPFFIKKLSMDRYFIKLDITLLECKICNRNINTIEQLIDHLKIEHQKILYTDVKNHIIPFKFVTDTLQCCICMNSFSKFKMLQEHMHTHYRNYICEICDVGYFNSFSLSSHKLTHVTGTYKCEYCLQIFDTKNKRRLHERAKHRDNKLIFKCGYCNEIFSDFRKKEAHLVSLHGLKIPTPKCQACDKVYPDRNKLQAHIKRVHLMQKPHKCSECDMSFCTALELKNHMVKHNRLRVFNCTVCLKAYPWAKTLKEHMKIHDNVRRFKCEHCGQAFVQKCSWKGHMKSKHGEIV